MTAAEAALEQKKGNYVVEEPGKGFRRIIASPKPIDIVEIEAIKTLSDAGQIVIACGGGGIPVLKQGSNLKGASAVIEKELVSGLLADLTDTDMQKILTNEEFVNIKYGCCRRSRHPSTSFQEKKDARQSSPQLIKQSMLTVERPER